MDGMGGFIFLMTGLVVNTVGIAVLILAPRDSALFRVGEAKAAPARGVAAGRAGTSART